jgi:hypothetical protein
MGVNSRRAITPAQRNLSFTSSTPVPLTVPAGANVAEITVLTASITFTRDGTIPTATNGPTAYPSDIIMLNSRDEIVQFRGIAVSATATGIVEYFTDVSG